SGGTPRSTTSPPTRRRTHGTVLTSKARNNLSVEAGAVSGGHRNECCESFRWFHPVEGSSGSVVEFEGDSVEICLAVSGEVGGFGEILAQQAVGVFVRSPLPRRMGVAEVDLHAGVDAELDMARELLAAVPGE